MYRLTGAKPGLQAIYGTFMLLLDLVTCAARVSSRKKSHAQRESKKQNIIQWNNWISSKSINLISRSKRKYENLRITRFYLRPCYFRWFLKRNTYAKILILQKKIQFILCPPEKKQIRDLIVFSCEIISSPSTKFIIFSLVIIIRLDANQTIFSLSKHSSFALIHSTFSNDFAKKKNDSDA